MNLDKHIWLINLIAQHPKGITLKEINDAVNKTTIKIPSPLNRITMLRYRDTIFQQFGVNISCASHAHYSTYFISNPEVLSNNTMEGWVCRNFMTNNLMAGSMSLKDRILPEAIPSNGSQLQQLLDAMANSAIITFTYKKYDGSTSHRQAEPYCVKLWNQRWYLLGHNATTLNDEDSDVVHVRKFAIFSLDRISDVSLSGRQFKINRKFSAKAYFNECFGVLSGDGTKAQRIVIRAYGKEAYYLRDLPLHHTQKEIILPPAKNTEVVQGEQEYVDFEYHMRPTVDLVDALLSHANRIKVLRPQHLADEMRDRIQSMLKQYE